MAQSDALARVSSAEVHERRDGTPVLRGSELVAVTERFGRGMLALMIALAAIVMGGLVVESPLGLTDALPPSPAEVGAAAVVALAASAALWRLESFYRALRSRPAFEFSLVACAAVLAACNGASQTLLEWAAVWILVVLAPLVGPRRMALYCLAVLVVDFAVGLITGDAQAMAAVQIVGVCILLPLCCVTVAAATEQGTAYLLRNNARAITRPAPVRVMAWTTTEEVEPMASPSVDRLSNRQVQVVLLLIEGLRYSEVAEALSISERQVGRHIANATERLGVRNTNELVAVVAAGLAVSG